MFPNQSISFFETRRSSMDCNVSMVRFRTSDPVLIARIVTPWTFFTRSQRSQGRVIEVRRNPVPGGGFALIYADITERTRAEEAIRAPRDSAESTLRELQTAQASLVHAQKMAALGQLTAGIAHEIKNPLNFVNNFAALSSELTDELSEVLKPVALPGKVCEEVKELTGTLKDNLGRVVLHGKRADSIVKNMLLHSREGCHNGIQPDESAPLKPWPIKTRRGRLTEQEPSEPQALKLETLRGRYEERNASSHERGYDGNFCRLDDYCCALLYRSAGREGACPRCSVNNWLALMSFIDADRADLSP
jgi:signal transduction histidine kinase